MEEFEIDLILEKTQNWAVVFDEFEGENLNSLLNFFDEYFWIGFNRDPKWETFDQSDFNLLHEFNALW